MPIVRLLAFALPDALLLAGGSLVTAVVCARAHRWALPLAWLVAGATDYATFHVLGWALLTGGAWASFLLMAPCALVGTTFALDLASAHVPVYRRARAAPAGWNVVKTLSQIVVFWTLLLGVVPWFLLRIEARLPWSRFDFPGRVPLAIALFVALSALGLTCGVIMARQGEGTPLPLDGPRRLVIAGPYGYVRNPMAIAGLGQGLCVAVGTGSWLLVAYALLGSAIWNWIVRPSEEQDVEQTFGDAFRRYRQAVRCWVPRRRRYHPESG